jgi:uncharacterized membrane protein YhaH (DUF805 family)
MYSPASPANELVHALAVRPTSEARIIGNDSRFLTPLPKPEIRMSAPNGPYDPYPQQPQVPGQQPSYGQPSYGQQPRYGQPYSPYPQGPGGTPYGYLRGGPVGFGDAIRLAVQNSLVYQGRASRSAYWWFALFSVILGFVCGFLQGIVSHSDSAAAGLLGLAPMWFVTIGVLVVSVPLGVRRLHDIDRSGFWVLISLVPIVGVIVLLVFSLSAGTPGPNRFG